MEPTMFQIEGHRFGQVARWNPVASIALAKQELADIKLFLNSWDWTFEIKEIKTDA